MTFLNITIRWIEDKHLCFNYNHNKSFVFIINPELNTNNPSAIFFVFFKSHISSKLKLHSPGPWNMIMEHFISGSQLQLYKPTCATNWLFFKAGTYIFPCDISVDMADSLKILHSQ